MSSLAYENTDIGTQLVSKESLIRKQDKFGPAVPYPLSPGDVCQGKELICCQKECQRVENESRLRYNVTGFALEDKIRGRSYKSSQ